MAEGFWTVAGALVASIGLIASQYWNNKARSRTDVETLRIMVEHEKASTQTARLIQIRKPILEKTRSRVTEMLSHAVDIAALLDRAKAERLDTGLNISAFGLTQGG